ncbi:YciI family protein [Phenylobacterium sp.]|uniref:YciI family protein n=1 Tax=Phenylobacterium sp. TaxID=1871053 RepID=UPI002812121E|nr:YciI family protein [Phenylobacterium sp.]
MLFALMCLDKPNALDVRMGAREAHLAYVRERLDQVKLAGPLLDDEGGMAGSLLILDVADRAAAEAFNAADPYTLAGLWGSVEIRAFKASIGQV